MVDPRAHTHEINLRPRTASGNCFRARTQSISITNVAALSTILPDFIEGKEFVVLLYLHADATAHKGFGVAKKFLDVRHPMLKSLLGFRIVFAAKLSTSASPADGFM